MRNSSSSSVCVLTGGRDPHYAFGLLAGLLKHPLDVEFATTTEMRGPLDAEGLRYLDLYSAAHPSAPSWRKGSRVFTNYIRLVRNAFTSRSRIFHVLWFYKFESFDNTVMTWLYRALGKRVVLTVHNVNRRARDGKDGPLNRFALGYLYRSVDHVFVHTPLMKEQLCQTFGADPNKITVIPFGVNSFVIDTNLARAEARRRLGLDDAEKVMLFFGNIAPYKGLDTLVEALASVPDCRLIIAGPIKTGCEAYWRDVEGKIASLGLNDRVRKDAKFIPEQEVEVYFKAADVAVLPYRTISQSGVLFLSLGFGLPVIASDAEGLAESLQEGETGFGFRAADPMDLAAAMSRYFNSELFANLDQRRETIIQRLKQKHSWESVTNIVYEVYGRIAGSAHLSSPQKSRDSVVVPE